MISLELQLRCVDGTCDYLQLPLSATVAPVVLSFCHLFSWLSKDELSKPDRARDFPLKSQLKVIDILTENLHRNSLCKRA
jgi:hypothetical protein